jgi:PAS domain S-box-containing protein
LEIGLDNALPDPSGDISFDAGLHFTALVNGSNDPMLSKDLTGRILSWNRGATRVFGYEPDEIIGQSILQLIPPDLHQAETELLRKLRTAEAIEPYEANWLRKDGQNIAVLVTVYPVTDKTGQVTGASKLVRDLTERKQADENRFRLAAIVDSADDAIISKNLNSIIKSWNEGARRMFGYTADEIV